MTVLLRNSVFLHIPKTGGTWVRKALVDAGLSGALVRSRERDEAYNGTLRSWHNVPTWDARYHERPNRFCFVRHPADWYRSYWAFRMWRKNWEIRENEFDHKCSSGEFPEFIDKVLQHYPDGYVTWLYAYFANHCTFVGKTENLPTDLLTALDLFEGKYDPRDIVLLGPKKVTPIAYKLAAIYGDGQLDCILETESDALERYDYA